ncbi:MAG: hypothetical protein LLF90_07265 [Methanomicrobiaceae archaeon]|uniref:lipopolysaccharide biosynthesis protein n=1 Tax=Methanoculleus sp. TaxID=90427 RepID=UPI00320FF46D|nr:hypothetical protein [Methanomicrobiaceae archaeon]
MDQAHKKDQFNLRAFGSDVLIYSTGQILLLAFGLVQSLIIPKYLSTADYGYWQLFLLYTTYVGILHLGFLDGILVRWAGKEFEEIKQEVPTAFRFLLLEQLLVVGVLALVLIAIDLPFLEIGLAVLANAIIVNILTFFIFTAQAVKRFKLVTAINISKGGLFLLLVLALFGGGKFGYGDLYLATIVTGSILLILFAIHLRSSLLSQPTPGKSLRTYGTENISIGLFVLLGNFMAVLLTTVDRLTVSSFFPVTQFAQYTFAMSMCAVVIMFVQAVSLVFFPYLSGSSSELRTRAYQLLRPAITIFWAGALVMYFPFTAWVEFYLPHYTASLPLMAILLCMIGFSSQIQILHVNFFKAYRKQRMYFALAGISLVCAVALYLLAATFFGTLASIAITAVISSLLWYLLNEFSLRRFASTDVQDIVKWLLVIGVYAGAFLVTPALVQGWMSGMVIYLAIFVLVTATALKSEVISLLSLISAVVNRNGDTTVVQTER